MNDNIKIDLIYLCSIDTAPHLSSPFKAGDDKGKNSFHSKKLLIHSYFVNFSFAQITPKN